MKQLMCLTIGNQEQFDGNPTSAGDMFVSSLIHSLNALIILKSRCTLVQTPSCHPPFSTQVYPQTSLREAFEQGMLLLHEVRQDEVAHFVQSDSPSGKEQAFRDSKKVQEDRISLICQFPSVLVKSWMLSFRCLSTFFCFTRTDPASPMSRDEDPGNWSSWQSSWATQRSEGIGHPQRGNYLGQSDSQIFTLQISSSVSPSLFIALAKLCPQLQGLSWHINKSFYPPMITSRQVIQSSGIDPPRFDLNLAKITARFFGEMCLAASILNPENPMLSNSVKQSAILCLTYSLSVFKSAKFTSHPQFRINPSVHELSDLAQWKSKGPQGTEGNSIPGLCPVYFQVSQAKPCVKYGLQPDEFLPPQQLLPEQWLGYGNTSFPFPDIWFTTASAQTLTPRDLQVLIIFLKASAVPILECSLYPVGWQRKYHGFNSPFSVPSQFIIDS